MRVGCHQAVVMLAAVVLSGLPAAGDGVDDLRLRGASRGARNGWITVHLQGTPAEIGFQHGRLLGREIADALAVAKLSLTHDGKRDWAFYRTVAETVFWPRVDDEYRREMQGIAEGAAVAGVKIDLWDVVALNANIEFGYYTATLDEKGGSGAPDKCSAFVATGRYTRDGRPVIAHNNWSGYLEGSRWNVIFDIRPAAGHRILMDGMPGLIHSGDDFGITSAGLAITETTITGFKGFDAAGIPEFVRARKAMQYASSIDDFDRIMREGNNGGYANAWLVADVKTGEIARLELGLRNVTLERTKDGYFAGANFPVSPKLAAEETKFKLDDPSLSANARRVRAEGILRESEGRIDLALAKRYLSDHHDAY
jgi:Phospholipase B